MSRKDLREYANEVLSLPTETRAVAVDQAIQVCTEHLWPLIAEADRITLSGPTAVQRELFTEYVPLAVHRLVTNVPKRRDPRVTYMRDLASSVLALCLALAETPDPGTPER